MLASLLNKGERLKYHYLLSWGCLLLNLLLSITVTFWIKYCCRLRQVIEENMLIEVLV